MALLGDPRSRAPFDASGRVVARRHVKLSREYAPGETIPASEGVSTRTLGLLWDQYAIDTLPQPPRVQDQKRR